MSTARTVRTSFSDGAQHVRAADLHWTTEHTRWHLEWPSEKMGYMEGGRPTLTKKPFDSREEVILSYGYFIHFTDARKQSIDRPARARPLVYCQFHN
jgi:hypothetical protein